MKLKKSRELKTDTFCLPGGKHSFAHSIACGALAEECVFENVPNIRDSKVILEVLKNIFKTVEFNKHTKIAHLKDPIYAEEIVITNDLLNQSRNIFCIIPALLNRVEKVTIIGVPTGCNIGERPSEWYYSILKQFGVEYKEELNTVTLSWKIKKSAHIHFEYPTMTGTVIALACACLVPERTELSNCSVEPSCSDQMECMQKLGVSMVGKLPNLQILHPMTEKKVQYECSSDRVYAVTLLTAAILAEKKFVIQSRSEINIPEFVKFMRDLNIDVHDAGTSIKIQFENDTPLKSTLIEAGSEPKFSSDWGPFALLILATKSTGRSTITDDVFLKRFQFINFYKDKRNFANVNLSESYKNDRKIAVAEIQGEKGTIYGGGVENCPDIRGSAAIILSAIVSEEPIEIYDEFQISRGYEDLVGNLENMGFIERC